jgi:hypothetical protein
MRVRSQRRTGRMKVCVCVRSSFWDIRCVSVCISFASFARCWGSSFFTLCAEIALFIFTFLNGDTHDCICRLGSPPFPSRTTTSGSYRVRMTRACGSGTCARGKRSSYFMATRLMVRPTRLYGECSTHFSLFTLCVHAFSCSSFCGPEPNRGHAGYQRLVRAREIMCVPLSTRSYQKVLLTLTGRLAGSYTTLQ